MAMALDVRFDPKRTLAMATPRSESSGLADVANSPDPTFR